ncbi:MAG: hypothetical protein JXR51_12490 [Bacteroidales bacterium]|nr:hypothetical protein [Bacteroidales bacterium]
MKKIIIGFLSLLFIGQMAVAQPIQDNAVIPMSITLNSILRLNIVSGGNIEFAFNTITDYASGLGLAGSQYQTRITIASSSNWSLFFSTTLDAFYELDGASTIPLTYVAYNFETAGNGANVIGTDVQYNDNAGASQAFGVFNDLDQTPAAAILTTLGTGNAGGTADNDFTIRWECGTTNVSGGGVGLEAIRNSGASSGRYSTNVLLSLVGI